ncbi:IclR family transcriptional regulator [Sedimentitalea todarodis]|uniref:IclR family transcriptional regulator C-terminal domain-containing protein n=1 Tax=Sedimentitalea todarodis TaxID=1631240 RepID=A0ABU3VHL1_9RHOB|nr:IclR family transcriptional regulator C-terminal domain-containing protein [Sedimentitalea todarodis]MDU9005578.1 IclR family transcriptional regulator C-terminal domain-containing protein [Sedimentitalea todarodis]
MLQLAQTRELTVPRKAAADAVISRLAEVTGETTHVSVLSGATVYPLASCESYKHSTRVIIDVQTFPLHATASGICALAFGPKELLASASENMQAFTADTPTTIMALERAVQSARETGFGRSDRWYEDDVCSLSAPIFDQTGQFAGAVSVASVATRFTAELDRSIQWHLAEASREISRNWGGEIPETVNYLWDKSTQKQNIMEHSS